MEVVRIGKINLVDAVCAQLREQIVSGKIAEGSKLDGETSLAASFHVSRVVIREALQQLRSEKLIVTRQGVGTFAANPENFSGNSESFDFTEKAYKDFLEFRECIEYKAIQLSRHRATEEDFAYLEQCLQEMYGTEEKSPEYNEADFEFHAGVVRCAHNDYLDNAMKANRKQVIRIFEAMNGIPGAGPFGKASHTVIKGLLQQGDAKEVIRKYDEMGKYNMVRLTRFFKNAE